MTTIPKPLRKELSRDPYYKTCARFDALHDHVCQPDPLTGRLIEWEHALIVAGRQVQERYAIIPICWFAHRGSGLKKEINEWIAINRATDEELLSISRARDYFLYRNYLNGRYGVYDGAETVPAKKEVKRSVNGINYPWLMED